MHGVCDLYHFIIFSKRNLKMVMTTRSSTTKNSSNSLTNGSPNGAAASTPSVVVTPPGAPSTVSHHARTDVPSTVFPVNTGVPPSVFPPPVAPATSTNPTVATPSVFPSSETFTATTPTVCATAHVTDAPNATNVSTGVIANATVTETTAPDAEPASSAPAAATMESSPRTLDQMFADINEAKDTVGKTFARKTTANSASYTVKRKNIINDFLDGLWAHTPKYDEYLKKTKKMYLFFFSCKRGQSFIHPSMWT